MGDKSPKQSTTQEARRASRSRRSGSTRRRRTTTPRRWRPWSTPSSTDPEVRGSGRPGTAHCPASTASIRCGPGSASARRSWSASSSAVVARVAGTPMPWASATKSRAGPPRSSSCPARLPSLAAPTRDSSCCEDRVGAVVADDRGDVGLLAGVGPQRRDRVHRAAVGLDADHRPVRAGDRRAQRHGQPVADRAAGQAQPVVPRARRRSARPARPRRSAPRRRGSRSPAAARRRPPPSPAGSARRWAAPAATPPARRASASGAATSRQRPQRGDAVLPRRAEHVHGAVLGHRVAGHVRDSRRSAPATVAPASTRCFVPASAAIAISGGYGSRATSGSPAPRVVRAGNVSASSRAPVPAATCAAASCPSASITSPPRNSTVGSPSASTAATSSTTDGATRGAGRAGSGAATSAPSSHETSAGQDQRRDRPGRGRRGRDRLGGVGGDVGRGQRAPHPAGDRAGDGVDVGLQRRVQPLVRAGVVADDVDHRRPGAAGVVQVGQPVAHARAQVQQRRGGAAGHPRVPVGRAGGHALEQGEHRAHVGDVVQRGDEVHLRGAGVGEADVDPRVRRACG